jgi:hypothetical protein
MQGNMQQNSVVGLNALSTFLAVESAGNMGQWDKYVYTSQCITGTNNSMSVIV